MAADAQALLALLRSEEEEMSALLVRLVEAESPSLEPEAQDEAFRLLAAELGALGFRVRRLRGGEGGDHLYARRPGARLPAQLVVGHLDTVWPTGTLARMPARSERGVVAGPGALDAKAGLVQLVFALRALRALRVPEAAAPLVLVVADEEIGSRDSRAHLCRLAALSCRALVLEPAFGPRGALKTARKGVGGFSIRISGRAAHAGLEPERGASAILELARVVQRLFELNDPARGISVNVGTIDGGLRSNVVAPEASATVDVRVPTRAAADAVERAIRGLRPSAGGLSLRVEGGFGRPPLEPTARNRALWAAAERAARQPKRRTSLTSRSSPESNQTRGIPSRSTSANTRESRPTTSISRREARTPTTM